MTEKHTSDPLKQNAENPTNSNAPEDERTLRAGRPSPKEEEDAMEEPTIRPGGVDPREAPTIRPDGSSSEDGESVLGDATLRPGTGDGARSGIRLSEGNPTASQLPQPPTDRIPRTEVVLPKRFDDYQILDEIGRGGMGVVYKARQVSLDRIVALKMIRGGDEVEEEDISRFLREAREVGSLEHPAIVRVIGRGEVENCHYYTMSYIDGQDLASRITAKGAYGQKAGAELVLAISEAMAYAHKRGVIHRDLKPGNILLDKDGLPHVTDFGLVKRVKTEQGESHATFGILTMAGQVMGTPHYMAPEQALGEIDKLGPPSDVYSLGAILGSVLLGRTPFRARDDGTSDPIAPRSLKPEISKDLEAIFFKCIETKPEDRYPSAQELAEDFKCYLAGQAVSARPVGTGEKIARWCKQNPISVGLIVLLLGAVGALIGILAS